MNVVVGLIVKENCFEIPFLDMDEKSKCLQDFIESNLNWWYIMLNYHIYLEQHNLSLNNYPKKNKLTTFLLYWFTLYPKARHILFKSFLSNMQVSLSCSVSQRMLN